MLQGRDVRTICEPLMSLPHLVTLATQVCAPTVCMYVRVDYTVHKLCNSELCCVERNNIEYCLAFPREGGREEEKGSSRMKHLYNHINFAFFFFYAATI